MKTAGRYLRSGNTTLRKHEEKATKTRPHEIPSKVFRDLVLSGPLFRVFVPRLSVLALWLWPRHGRRRLALRGGLAEPRHLRRLRLERGRVGFLRAKLAEHCRGAGA